MEISGPHVQIIVTVIVIINAACLALLCDFLKARGRRLRENVVEPPAQRAEDGNDARQVLTFTRLLKENKPFTGLVISIHAGQQDEASINLLSGFITELLRETEFSCRSGPDEFVIVCSGERGPQARRRLSDISERLWDFQLRTLGASSILFAWGGADIHHESFAHAVVVARERMYQTKRGRVKKAV